MRLKMSKFLVAHVGKIRKMKSIWGNRCHDFDPCCASCVAWKIFKKRGDIPSLEDIASFPGSRIRFKSGAD